MHGLGDRVPGVAIRIAAERVPYAKHLSGQGGRIVLQGAVEIRDGDTAETLHARIQQVEHRLLPEAVRLFLDGKLTPALSA